MNNLTKNYIERKEEFEKESEKLNYNSYLNQIDYIGKLLIKKTCFGCESDNYELDKEKVKQFHKSDILSVLDVIEKWIDKNEYCSKCCSPKKYCREFGKYASALDTKDLLQFVKEAREEINNC